MDADAQTGRGGTVGPCDADPTKYSLDTNADGGIDLSDFVYGLNWFFQGTEAPRVCLATTDLEARLAVVESDVAALQSQHPVDWSSLTNVPAGFADGLDDDSVLSEAEVDAFADNNGYATQSALCTLIRDYVVGNSGDLVTISGCTEIRGGLHIAGPDLTDLSALAALTSVGRYCNIQDNPLLSSLSGLDALTSVGDRLDILDNPSLISLSGLEALTTVGGSIQITNNAPLTSLSGLEALTTGGGSLSIIANPSLTSLSGLEALSSVEGDLYIADNPELCESYVAAFLANATFSVSGSIITNNNGSNCPP